MEDESYIPSNIELIDKFIQQDIQNLSLSEKEIADKRNTILAIFAEWRIADSENKNQINNSKIVLPSQDIAPEIVIIPGIFHGTTTHHEYSISEKNYIKDNKIYKSNLPSQYILDIYCDIGTIHTHVYKINSDETGAELTFDIYETPQYEGDNYPKKDTEKPVSYIRTLYINDRFVPNEFR